MCEKPRLRPEGPTAAYIERIDAGAFGEGTFYWSEYHFVSGAPFSTIVGGPIGKSGTVLINNVPGSVSRLRVTADTIFVECNDTLAFSLSGAALPAPDPAVAFPATTTALRSEETGLFKGTDQLSERAWDYAETDKGVYYIPYDGADHIKFVTFAQPGMSITVSSVYEMPGDREHGATGSVFNQLWVNGTVLYVDAVLWNRKTHAIDYGDLSVIGQ